MIRTVHTRLVLDPGPAGRLDAYAALYGKAERTLFAAAAKGGNLDQLKSDFSARFGLTARQYNALSRSVKGKIGSLIEVRKLRIADIGILLSRLEKAVNDLPAGSRKRHEQQRRMGRLTDKLRQLQQDQESGNLRLCFGGGKLFHAQHHLPGNGYPDHAAWKQDWQAARSDEVFVLGSKDETAGCQGCQLTPKGNGTYAVKLRLPNALLDPERTETHLSFAATFDYGRKEIDAALAAGIALSYRFLRDAKGWRMLVSTDVQGAVVMNHLPGALGVDVNADHLALTLMDGAGNPLMTMRVALVTYGCSAEQAKARIGEAVKQVIAIARTANIAIIIEKLDFTAKKRSMKDQGVRYARMLSSFSYNRILETLKARAFDAGIRIQEVNPAYTSILGKQKFAQRYGLSDHGAAALAIARRSLSFSERPNRTSRQGTSPAPARKRGEHVWRHWARKGTEERRKQRAPGRRKAIPAATGALTAHGAGGTKLGAAGGIPARESVPSTVRGASVGEHRCPPKAKDPFVLQ
jgi:IS605 OrfB family transposase